MTAPLDVLPAASPYDHGMELDSHMTPMDRIFAMRDRMLARPGFQRWVARFPLSRGFARRKEKALFGIIAGFVYTQVLTAGLRLGLYDLLKQGPLPLETIAVRIGLAPDEARRLIKASVALELLSERSGGRYGLGDLGSAVAATPAFASIIEHNAIFYRDLSDPVRLLKGDYRHTQLSSFWSYAHSDAPEALSPETVAAYTAFMAESQVLIADDILDAYSMAGHRHLLDVGGGDGTFIAAAGRRAPHLQLTLFDLPAVAERAKAKLGDPDLSPRVRIAGGSFLDDPLPMGADVATLIRVLLDHDDRTVLRILARVREALPPGGTLLIAETLAGTPASDAYFGFYLMAMGRGASRSEDELAALLKKSGFSNINRVQTFRATLTGLIAATRDAGG